MSASTSEVGKADGTAAPPQVLQISKVPPLHIIFFVVVNIWFCFCISPFLAAGANPVRNLQYLKILVADFDHGYVGSTLTNSVEFITKSLEPDVYTFETVDTSVCDQNCIKGKIEKLDAYAAIWANDHASSNLDAVFGSSCAAIGSYSSMNAYTIFWDEGRSFNTANKIFGFLSSLVPKLNGIISTNLLTSQSPSVVASCISAVGGANILSNPVDVRTINLSPVMVAPVGQGLLSIGNILVAVFSALFFVNTIYMACAPVYAHMNDTNKALYRALLFIIYDFGLAACLATIVVGLSKDGSGNHLYSGAQWAQIFALQWVHAALWTFGTACVFVGISPIFVPYNFACILVSSILGGWNTDLSDPSYFEFYKIFPFTWVNNIEKYILYGSMKNEIGGSVGIILAQAVFFILLYFWLCYKYQNMKPFVFDFSNNDAPHPSVVKTIASSTGTTSNGVEMAPVASDVSTGKTDYIAVNVEDKP